jgi:ornithine--oxo-acid transaminase
MRRGLLCKDTHESTIRLAPPLTIEERELEFLLDAVRAELG